MLAGKEPFLWEGGGNEAVLCLHGFTGAPGVFRKLGRALLEEGFTVYAPTLPGHGTVPEDLAGVTGVQLLSATERAYTRLAGSYSRVHIVGLSLGGTLATLLAARYAGERELGCVSLLSPGYGFNKNLSARLGLGDGSGFDRSDDRMIPLMPRKPRGDEMDECIFGYGAVSLTVFARLQMLNAAAYDARAGVRSPVLLLYAERDTVVDSDVCAEADVFPRLEEAHSFKESEHNLLLGCDREEAAALCAAFIRRHRIKNPRIRVDT